MDIKNNRKIVFGIGIILSFALLIISITLYFNYEQDQKKEGRITTDLINQLSKEELIDYLTKREDDRNTFKSIYLYPLFSFIGLLVGSIVYYVMSDKIIQKENSLDKNSKIILNFLTSPERKVIETLLENEGKVQQYELSHLPNLNKLKTHRILINLEQKGIIHKEKLGKINKIVLNKELYDVLK